MPYKSEADRAYHAAKREEYRRSGKQRLHSLRAQGISDPTAAVQLIRSAERCELCGISAEDLMATRKKKASVLQPDHDHKTGRLRGALCSKCNTAIGLLNDSPDLARKAADYLDRYK